jgi:hypothetical protein
MRLDVIVFGGGAAGLWCLDRLRQAGYHAILLESHALGEGQTIQAQGIIHGGGKYALRGVRDFAAVRATSSMPERWRRSIAGELEPDLSGIRILSDRCYLWLPRRSAFARLPSLALMGLVTRAGLLATPPEQIPKPAWPEALRDSAAAVCALAEPVIETGSFLERLAARHQDFIFMYEQSSARFTEAGVRIGGVLVRAGAFVFTAGAGNADLLVRVGMHEDLMQCRPLGMVLLRGNLPPLFGHCIVAGKTALTVTTPAPGLWQIGGEIAERLATESDSPAARYAAIKEIRRRLPELSLGGSEIAVYRALRAEARTAAARRPSGVHASQVAPGVIVGWPTKLSMAPILADEVLELVRRHLKAPAGYDELPAWPSPTVASYPWEKAQWFAVH